MEDKKPIRSFRDLDVYQRTYAAAIEVMAKIIPKDMRQTCHSV